MLRFQNQLIKIGLNVGVEKAWADVLELESVDSPHHVAESETNGLCRQHFSRFKNANFFPKRRRTVVDDDEIIDHLDEFLQNNCPLGIRSRDVRKVPGREEKERVRIVTDTWKVVFAKYNEEREKSGLKKISFSALRMICRNHLPHYRRASRYDREYALRSPCAQLESHLEVLTKNSMFQDWNINKEQLLAKSVCSDDNYNCLWGRCDECNENSTLQKLISSIPNYDDIKEEDVEYAMIMSYEVKEGKKTKTSVWVNQFASVEDFVIDLSNSLFVSSSKGTGKKVSFCHISNLFHNNWKVILHTKREREISTYLHDLLYEIEEGADTAKCVFDHGDYKSCYSTYSIIYLTIYLTNYF